MLETNRKNGKVSSPGSLPRKLYPPGPAACLPTSLFSGKSDGFILLLLLLLLLLFCRQRENFQEIGDLLDSFFKEKFLCLQ